MHLFYLLINHTLQRNKCLTKLFIQKYTLKSISKPWQINPRKKKIETDISIIARFSFDFGPLYEYLKNVFMFADEVDFEKGTNEKDMSVILTFRTHKLVL